MHHRHHYHHHHTIRLTWCEHRTSVLAHVTTYKVCVRCVVIVRRNEKTDMSSAALHRTMRH